MSTISLAGYQINPIDVNFHLKRSLEIVDTKSEDKIWSKKDKEIKMSTLMPNRVNCTHQDWQIKVSDLHCFLIFWTFAEKLLQCVFALVLFDLCHSYYIHSSVWWVYMCNFTSFSFRHCFYFCAGPSSVWEALYRHWDTKTLATL